MHNFVGKHLGDLDPSPCIILCIPNIVQHRIHVCLEVSQGDGLVVLLEAIVALQRLSRPAEVIIGSRLIILWRILHQQFIS